ncbi:hypothetical protein Tco_0914878 [Tanacetum coccineum]
MKRVSKGYSGVITLLFDTMLVYPRGEELSIQTTPETSPSKITSLPSLLSYHTSISALSTSQPPITPTEEAASMPHESPLHSVYSLRRDEGKDSSKQGRKISDIDINPTILLVQPQQDMEYDFDATASIPITTIELEISTAKIAVSTADAAVTTASASISIVSPLRVSTVEDISGAETLVYIRRSASKAKDKGKATMQESEPPKKIKKMVQEARLKVEQEQERIDFETALELQRQYHALQNRTFSVAEVRKNMCMYLKNQGGYKMSHLKGMSYEEIRPILHIFMLVEKRYPLIPITITNMLNKKLQADYWNEMCYQLLKLMFRGGLLGFKDFKMILRVTTASTTGTKVYAAGLQLLEELLLSEG